VRTTSHTTPRTAPGGASAVIHQVYIRSFADGDGDGTGDIAVLRSRLPYLACLGVDAVSHQRPRRRRRPRHLGPVQPRRDPPRHPLRPRPHRRDDPDARPGPPVLPRPRHPPRPRHGRWPRLEVRTSTPARTGPVRGRRPPCACVAPHRARPARSSAGWTASGHTSLRACQRTTVRSQLLRPTGPAPPRVRHSPRIRPPRQRRPAPHGQHGLAAPGLTKATAVPLPAATAVYRPLPAAASVGREGSPVTSRQPHYLPNPIWMTTCYSTNWLTSWTSGL
jgi:hypothetical protein